MGNLGSNGKLTGSGLISKERTRQIEEEGWTEDHDKMAHGDKQLADAAACYLLYGQDEVLPFGNDLLWPWDEEWWKPSPYGDEGYVRSLVKAGALIAAEIDRIQGEAATTKED